MSQAKDLFLLSALAYQQGKIQDSAALYASAMSSTDVKQFLDDLSAGAAPSTSSLLPSLSAAVDEFTSALAAEQEDEPVETDLDEDGDDEEWETDDLDPDAPGEKILPTSISSTSTLKPKAGLRSPVTIR